MAADSESRLAVMESELANVKASAQAADGLKERLAVAETELATMKSALEVSRNQLSDLGKSYAGWRTLGSIAVILGLVAVIQVEWSRAHFSELIDKTVLRDGDMIGVKTLRGHFMGVVGGEVAPVSTANPAGAGRDVLGVDEKFYIVKATVANANAK